MTSRTHPVGSGPDRGPAVSVLGDVAGARARALQAGAEYRAAVVAAVDELEQAGARDAFSRVAEAAGVSRQTVRTLVGRARADR